MYSFVFVLVLAAAAAAAVAAVAATAAAYTYTYYISYKQKHTFLPCILKEVKIRKPWGAGVGVKIDFPLSFGCFRGTKYPYYNSKLRTCVCRGFELANGIPTGHTGRYATRQTSATTTPTPRTTYIIIVVDSNHTI